jgi:hypothetical protein
MKRTLIALIALTMALPSYASDSDHDGINDTWEMAWFGSLTNANATTDHDSDGLTDLQEYLHDTNPLVSDSDGDTIPDYWEIQYELDPNNDLDGTLDIDGDGLVNSNEFFYSCNPLVADTDIDDGVINSNECYAGSNPFTYDTDNDGLSDSNEFYHIFETLTWRWEDYSWIPTNAIIPITSANNKDSDGDGVSDFDEVFAGTNPNDPNDYLEFNAFVTNDFLTLTWKPAWNRGYYVMMTTNLFDNNSWTNITQPLRKSNLVLFYPMYIDTNGCLASDYYGIGAFATNMNQLCSWAYPLTNNISNAYYKIKVTTWIDWTTQYYPRYPPH